MSAYRQRSTSWSPDKLADFIRCWNDPEVPAERLRARFGFTRRNSANDLARRLREEGQPVIKRPRGGVRT